MNSMNGMSMCVLIEALAGYGIFGSFFFFRYLYILIFKEKKLIIKYLSKNELQLITSIIVAFSFEMIILCFNQNILRPSLWAHISILSALYLLARQKCKC